MKLGEVKVAEDEDFDRIKQLISKHEDWKLEYQKGSIQVWTKSTDDMTNFKMFKAITSLKDIPAEVLFDVLLDPEYRKLWDRHMIESYDIGCLNPNNDIGYYAIRCPSPIKNRDFVLQRSWLDTGKEYLVLNHSVFHDSIPPKKAFIRGISYLTGYIIKPTGKKSCDFSYVTQSDPKGSLPAWVVNKLTHYVAPKMIKRLHKACLGYDTWKMKNNPQRKPWLYPEQMTLSRINLSDMEEREYHQSYEFLEESMLEECSFEELLNEEMNDD